MRTQPTKPSLASLVAFTPIAAILYVLSYAPVFQLTYDEPAIPGGGQFVYQARQGWQETYRPVEWITDNTPLRDPLLDWAALWGEEAERDFRWRSDRRIEGNDPYPARESLRAERYAKWDALFDIRIR